MILGFFFVSLHVLLLMNIIFCQFPLLMLVLVLLLLLLLVMFYIFTGLSDKCIIGNQIQINRNGGNGQE
jgi:hypothetical protein